MVGWSRLLPTGCWSRWLEAQCPHGRRSIRDAKKCIDAPLALPDHRTTARRNHHGLRASLYRENACSEGKKSRAGEYGKTLHKNVSGRTKDGDAKMAECTKADRHRSKAPHVGQDGAPRLEHDLRANAYRVAPVWPGIAAHFIVGVPTNVVEHQA